MSSLRLAAKIVASILLAFALSSCVASDETMALEVVGYNHTNHDIGFFTVNGQGGAYLGKHEGGGGFVCCVAIPNNYKPGMTVTVRWGGEEVGKTREKVVEVPPYKPEDGGAFNVHFLRGGDVKVFVTMYMLGHPKYPLSGAEAKL
ncbi:DUF3304 domain-containing protein [Paraburkholderia sp. J63]|uniref:DUF3304 domain-containing protein n=1 Tax=Paraburkholderia sp. J63 TaxID=2805434 RepID=UPI002ABD6D7C|nr:DUF3304 domain-containing protein [Paraburkholderia sp. J63]